MNTRALGCLFAVSALCLSAVAKTTTWTGTTGASWDSASNWNNGRPENGDSVVVSGSSANDIEGLSLASLVFEGSGACALSGNALTLAGTVGSTCAGGTTVSAPLVLASGERTFTVDSDCTVSCTGVISGAGKLTKSGAGTLQLRTTNTYTGGTHLTAGYLEAYAQNALGTGTADIDNTGCQFRICAAVDLANAFNSSLNAAGVGMTISATTSTFRFCNGSSISGALTAYGKSTYEVPAGATASIKGDLKTTHGVYDVATKGTLKFEGKVNMVSTSIWEAYSFHKTTSGGTFVFSGTGSNKYLIPGLTKGKVLCGRAFTLPAACELKIQGYGWEGQTVDLCGFDQKLSMLQSNGTDMTGGSAGHAGHYLRSTGGQPTTLTLTGGNQTGGYTMQDKLTFVWDSATDATYTFVNAATHTTSGSLIVSNGTIKVQRGSFANVPGLTVADGSTFEIGADAGQIGNGHLAIDLGSTASLVIPEGKTLYADSLVVGGNPLVSVRSVAYGTAEHPLAQITGGGTLVVAASEVPSDPHTWTGQGSSARLSDAGNWNTKPTLDNGSLVATFATSGTSAQIDANALIKGIVFDIPGSAFSLSSIGDAVFSLFAGGITTADTADEKTYVIDAPFEIETDQTWDVKGASSILSITKPFVCTTPHTVTKSGAGTLNLSQDSSGAQTTFNVVAGKVNVSSAGALGSGAVSVNGGKLAFDSPVTLSNALTLAAVNVGAANNAAVTFCNGATLAGSIKLNGTSLWSVPKGATAVIRGDVTAASGLFDRATLGTVRFEGKILMPNTDSWNWEARALRKNAAKGTFIIAGEGNTFQYIPDFCQGIVTCGRAGTMPVNASVTFKGYGWDGQTFDLGGYDQTFKQLATDGKSSTMVGTSGHAGHYLRCTGGPATLTLTGGDQMAGYTMKDDLSLVWNSSSGETFSITNSATHTMTGSLIASNGTIRVLCGSFGQISAWGVANGGRIDLGTGSGAFGSRTTVATIDGAGKVTLPADKVVRVKSLTINGRVCNGTWGSSSSPAMNADDVHFAGTGVVRAPGGSMVILR